MSKEIERRNAETLINIDVVAFSEADNFGQIKINALKNNGLGADISDTFCPKFRTLFVRFVRCQHFENEKVKNNLSKIVRLAMRIKPPPMLGSSEIRLDFFGHRLKV